MLAPIIALTLAVAPVVYEDDPAWNCYTMGNETCGTLTYIESDSEYGLGAILPKANDERVYVSWENGDVTRALPGDRLLAWQVCVMSAEGGDASLFACDDDYAEDGDDFNLREWEGVDGELGDALAEGGAPDAATRDWEACSVHYDDTSIIACPDGWTEVS